jgi:hypothetical protein
MYIYISFSLMHAVTMSPKKKKEKEQMLAGDSVPAAASQVSFAPGAAANSSAASQAPLPSVCVPCIHRERERERERDVFA